MQGPGTNPPEQPAHARGTPRSAQESSLQPESYGRAFVKNVTFGLASALTRFGLGMLVVAYVIRRIGTERWGLVVVATSVVTFLALIQLGASAGLGKKLNSHLTCGRFDDFARCFTAGLVLCLGLSGVVAVGILVVAFVVWPALNINPAFAREGQLVLLATGAATICTSMNLPFLAGLQALHRLDVDATVNIVAIVARSLAIFAAFELWSASALTYALALLGGGMLILFGDATWVLRHVPHARLTRSGLNLPLFKELVSFNVLTLFNSLNYVAFMQAPALILTRLGEPGLLAAGLYGSALQLNNLTRGLLMPGYNALLPMAASLEARRELDQLRRVFLRSTRFFGGVAALTWVGFAVLGDRFLSLWLGSNLAGLPDLQRALPWLIGTSALGIATLPAAAYLVALERLRLSAVSGVALAALLVALLLVLLPPSSGKALLYAAIFLCVCFGLYQLIRVAIVASELSVSVSELLKALVLRPTPPAIAAAATALLCVRPAPTDSILWFVLSAVACALVFVLCAAVFLLDADERSRIPALVRRWRGDASDPPAPTPPNRE